MKKVIPFLLALGLALPAISQDFQAINQISFKNKKDYKEHEPEVLQCADYLLSNPLDKNSLEQKVALRLIIQWSSGTPDFTFELDGTLSELMKKNDDVLPVLMTAMVKFALDHPDQVDDKKQMKLHTYEIFIDYCKDEKNGVKQSKELKKAIQAKEDGKLESYLGL